MSQNSNATFSPRGTSDQIENGLSFQPKFDDDGLIPAIVTARSDGAVLMFAWMNQDALKKTIESGEAHFWSRSRAKLWRKGEESGNTLAVSDIRVDCDQDVILLICDLSGEGRACHTGARSCFYRSVDPTSSSASSIQLKPVS